MRIVYNIGQAFKQIWRNKGMSVASIFSITAMMLILGLFFVLTMNINLFSEMIKNDYDQVELFLEDEITREQADQMMNEVLTFGGVHDVAYRSRDEAMGILKKRWGENAYMLDNLGDNPLPNSIIITADDMESAMDISVKAAGLQGVEDVKYYRETVEKIAKVTNSIQIGALILMGVLVVISVVVVSNTIKLTVTARSREIGIMKYIGATNWFIRGPFLAEGILIGVLSSGVSALITYFAYKKIIGIVGADVIAILSSPLVPAGYLARNLVIVFLALGASVGACGSIISMRKFLDT